MDLIKVNGKLLELLLLNALNEHKAYGYELTNRFTPIYQKSSGAIYLALKSLCERELVSRESELFAGRIRVYYALSSEGSRRIPKGERKVFWSRKNSHAKA